MPLPNTTPATVYFSLKLSGTTNPAAGKTVTAYVSKDGSAWASAVGSVAEIGDGEYCFLGSSSNFDCAGGDFKFAASGCDNAFVKFNTTVLPANFSGLTIDAGSGGVNINPGQTSAYRNQDSVTQPTTWDCLHGAWTEAFGKQPTFNQTTWVKQLPDNTGPARTLILTTDVNNNVTARR